MQWCSIAFRQSDAPGRIRLRILTVANKSFGKCYAPLHAAKTIHWIVKCPKLRFWELARMGKAGGLLSGDSRRDIHIVSGMKDLGLFGEIDFVIIEVEFLATFPPGIVGQERSSPMVSMGVDWPVGEDDVGLLGFEEFSKFLVMRLVDFRMTINLAGKYRPRPQNCARFQALCGSRSEEHTSELQ